MSLFERVQNVSTFSPRRMLESTSVQDNYSQNADSFRSLAVSTSLSTSSRVDKEDDLDIGNIVKKVAAYCATQNGARIMKSSGIFK